MQSEKTSAKRDKEAESQRDLEEAPGAARSGLQEKAPLVKEDPQILLGTDGSKSPDPRCSKLALYVSKSVVEQCLLANVINNQDALPHVCNIHDSRKRETRENARRQRTRRHESFD